MKRLIALISVIILTTAGAGASAQENHARIGWGGYPIMDNLFSGGWGCIDIYSFADLHNIYGDYMSSTYTTGAIYAEYAWDIKKWFTASVSATTDIIWENYRSATTDQKTGTDTGFVLHAMGKARFNWVSRQIVRMYSSISLGFITGYLDEESIIFPGVQINPVGIEIGGKIFGFCELGFGTTYTGAMAGIGFRF